jgi:redox-sensitive bicupin YhaK (pirin superfamily)
MSNQKEQSTINIKRASDRFSTEIGWLDSYHSFSFGPHYHPNKRDNSIYHRSTSIYRRRLAII